MAGRIKWSDGQGVMVNRCPTGHHHPESPQGMIPQGARIAGVRQDTDLIVAPDTAAQSA